MNQHSDQDENFTPLETFKSDPCDKECGNDHLVAAATVMSTSIQVPELLLRPYKECKLRTQQIMRAKGIDSLEVLANKFVHDISLFKKELVNSGKWQLTFGSGSLTQKPPVSSDEHSFLSRLAAECKSFKDKDTNKEFRKNAAKQSQKVLIGD